jgi:hypothetical protein
MAGEKHIAAKLQPISDAYADNLLVAFYTIDSRN